VKEIFVFRVGWGWIGWNAFGFVPFATLFSVGRLRYTFDKDVSNVFVQLPVFGRIVAYWFPQFIRNVSIVQYFSVTFDKKIKLKSKDYSTENNFFLTYTTLFRTSKNDFYYNFQIMARIKSEIFCVRLNKPWWIISVVLFVPC
jgi:hypothetical protein